MRLPNSTSVIIAKGELQQNALSRAHRIYKRVSEPSRLSGRLAGTTRGCTRICEWHMWGWGSSLTMSHGVRWRSKLLARSLANQAYCSRT